MVSAAVGKFHAPRVICSRAHAGLVEAKAKRLVLGEDTFDDAVVPAEFWWSHGGPGLNQSWSAGDFETWIDGEDIKAYGVSFSRSAIDALAAPTRTLTDASKGPAAGGRPPAAWWDDLWVEICRQLYVGDLKPKRQADVVTAMLKWVSANGHEAAETTIKERARKLWHGN